MYKQREKKRYAKRLRRNQTAGEKAMWWCRALGYKPQVITPAGFIADFYNSIARVIIEVDGSIHKNDVQRLRDRRRDKIHRKKRIYTIRVSDRRARKQPFLLMCRIAYITIIWWLWQTYVL